MTDLVRQLTSELQEKIQSFQPQLEIRNVGTVIEAGDGIAQVEGLAGVQSQELVEFENGVMGIAFNLEKDRVGVTILGDYLTVSEGMQVRS
ncbi:MAG: F0F1 ATP synthase subunit alpha, partial [Bellilinea sp.]|nr:F0F1 ATP synthase subunit alpha [Bellilinea sp.]